MVSHFKNSFSLQVVISCWVHKTLCGSQTSFFQCSVEMTRQLKDEREGKGRIKDNAFLMGKLAQETYVLNTNTCFITVSFLTVRVKEV